VTEAEWPYECDECGRKYKVPTANNACLGKPDGSRCFGRVVETRK
jgi:hypothetical protein